MPIITTCHTANSTDQSVFALQNDLAFPAPSDLGPGYFCVYFGQTQSVLSYDPITLTGTLNAPMTTPLEGGHDIQFYKLVSTGFCMIRVIPTGRVAGIEVFS